ncbi:MAG TPA: hypothetical protein VD928_00815 [Candidatus Paceibacterota bacterium]|nr:hypothetical protein [Candidatus Paceibacterota bacterium]
MVRFARLLSILPMFLLAGCLGTADNIFSADGGDKIPYPEGDGVCTFAGPVESGNEPQTETLSIIEVPTHGKYLYVSDEGGDKSSNVIAFHHLRDDPTGKIYALVIPDKDQPGTQAIFFARIDEKSFDWFAYDYASERAQKTAEKYPGLTLKANGAADMVGPKEYQRAFIYDMALDLSDAQFEWKCVLPPNPEDQL